MFSFQTHSFNCPDLACAAIAERKMERDVGLVLQPASRCLSLCGRGTQCLLGDKAASMWFGQFVITELCMSYAAWSKRREF